MRFRWTRSKPFRTAPTSSWRSARISSASSFRCSFGINSCPSGQRLGSFTVSSPFPTPEPVAEGEPGGWSYLVMTRLSGVSGKEAWPLLPEAQKQHLAGQLGALIAEVQSLPPGELSRLEPQWRPFILGQIEGCRARHERLGLPRKFLRGMDKLLDDARRLIPLEPQSVILTGEYVPENLLFVQRADEWRLSGLIDFGDVMTGFRDYDLMGPSAFMTMGEPARLAAFLAGFGYEKADIDDAFGRRLMALLMLHRFSDPMRHLAIKSWHEMADDFEGLERLLWPRG
jgi:hygromycin-B 7''-O-kinase